MAYPTSMADFCASADNYHARWLAHNSATEKFAALALPLIAKPICKPDFVPSPPIGKLCPPANTGT